MNQTFDALFPTLNTVSAHGLIRQAPEDFMVFEHNELNFTESGEHLWLKVEKVNCNTAWVATQISSACKVPARQVGFAGLKDRHAITQQWFSVQLPKISDLAVIQAKLPAEVKIIECHWHKSKIKTGFLTYNEFKLRVRGISSGQNQIEENIEAVQLQGVPNYFGPQRFGHDMNNIEQAKDWFAGKIKVNNKNLRGLLISTARSHIFNLIVAHRINNQTWHQVIPGDVLQLNASHSWFPAHEATTDELARRLSAFDLHITAAMWGEDPVQSTDQCAAIENQIAKTQADYQAGFTTHRVKQDRRAIRIHPKEMTHQWDGNDLLIGFKLQAGAYATSILREVLQIAHDF
ncbi:tRNA pseudouridine(13) synthase TruD [Marinicella litoralis]|uniref:tRNA pseudouridine synthase D n=1 Tax=Marinicella litoralis TaxID=644220 RepID=A0A4R6Y0R7_9GAMM|nr:tRNA pseudouridine(13) synthase TruD [Marinicella litoralis]TDR22518.1 TruD family tRNA pseudouridine synthase [Marinicella litoralis]